ncbi:hypothetical protein GCM10009681_45020 [Luedemannella helvata]|uniref:Uncharacterized protein n=1 Tax=Luedemannella helvata TaxID=349315 RepID=A0ABP4X2G7_9ACTN
MVGATILGTAVWFAVDAAWPSWPQPRDSDALYKASIISVAVDTGPEVGTGLAVAALLLGSVLTVLACARLSAANNETC